MIGDPAASQIALNPANTIFDAKRLIGRKFNDDTVQADIKLWPFKEGIKPRILKFYSLTKLILLIFLHIERYNLKAFLLLNFFFFHIFGEEKHFLMKKENFLYVIFTALIKMSLM